MFGLYSNFIYNGLWDLVTLLIILVVSVLMYCARQVVRKKWGRHNWFMGLSGLFFFGIPLRFLMLLYNKLSLYIYLQMQALDFGSLLTAGSSALAIFMLVMYVIALPSYFYWVFKEDHFFLPE